MKTSSLHISGEKALCGANTVPKVATHVLGEATKTKEYTKLKQESFESRQDSTAKLSNSIFPYNLPIVSAG